VNSDETVVFETESVCPECLKKISAYRVARGSDIYLRKTCPEHGSFETILWRGETPDYGSWEKPKIPSHPEHPFTEVVNGCPYDCGLCAEHRQDPCCVLLEVTRRCDLGCPLCFASSGGGGDDPDLTTIEMWYQRLNEAGGPFNIQLSGGEPCLRDDLPEIIRLGISKGFSFFQVNTNGLRLAKDKTYLEKLKEAGLSVVYLQFDGVDDMVYETIRGRKLLAEKMKVIEHCADLQVGLVLVPTLIPGVNDRQIGNIVKLALQYHPTIRGVHFQPVSYFGRYPSQPQNQNRLTLPEIINQLEVQTDGLLKAINFKPSGGENARCSFHGNFVIMPDGSLKPLTRHDPKSCCCKPGNARQGRLKAQHFVSRAWAAPKTEKKLESNGPSLGEWDIFLERARTHVLAISGMAFQDAWTLDLERLKECYILTVSPEGKLIPFCAYNLTSRSGQSLYRQC
jgi:7,8-dihydro-6-hydroxymethylpterin dimethyltransferase